MPYQTYEAGNTAPIVRARLNANVAAAEEHEATAANPHGMELTQDSIIAETLVLAGVDVGAALVDLSGAPARMRDLSFPITADGEALVSAPGVYSFCVGAALDGYRIVAVGLGVMQAGDGGPTTAQVRRARDTAGTPRTRTELDVLSTVLTLDSQHVNSTTSTAPAVIDATHALLQKGDFVFFDIETVSPVAPTGATGSITVQ